MLALLTAALPANLAVTLLRSRGGRATRRHRPAPRDSPYRADHRREDHQGPAAVQVVLERRAPRRARRDREVPADRAPFLARRQRLSCRAACDGSRYPLALLEIVRAEDVDVFVPVSSPLASRYDAEAAELLRPYCEIVHADADLVRMLDDKYAFAAFAAALGLPVPDTHRMSSAAEVADFRFDTHPGSYVLKNLDYDPVNRLDLTPLPRPTGTATATFASTKPITNAAPWILQSFVRGREYCTHSTVRDGELVAHVCCESSAFQLNYEAVDKPEIEAWVRTFVAAARITGQVSFDFIEADDGTALAIECNPRTHSAITTFHDQPDLAAAYLGDLPAGAVPVRPRPGSRPTYWIYQEAWRLLTRPTSAPRATADRPRRQGRDLRLGRPAAVPVGPPPADPLDAAAQPGARQGMDPHRRQHRQTRRAGRRLTVRRVLRVLHLVGSPASDFFAELSLFMPAAAWTPPRTRTLRPLIAYVSPDGAGGSRPTSVRLRSPTPPRWDSVEPSNTSTPRPPTSPCRRCSALRDDHLPGTARADRGAARRQPRRRDGHRCGQVPDPRDRGGPGSAVLAELLRPGTICPPGRRRWW